MLRTNTKNTLGIDGNGLRPEHLRGAISELTAQQYYLEQGYQVFIPVTQQGWVDFVVYKDNKLLRVQVKTAGWNFSNKNSEQGYLQCRTRLTNKYQDVPICEQYDILFIVKDTHKWEIPSADIESSNLSLLKHNSDKKYKWDKYKVSC